MPLDQTVDCITLLRRINECGRHNQTITAQWDLNSEEATPFSNRFAGLFVIEIQVKYAMVDGVNQPIGYVLTNPRIQMYTGEIEVEIEGIVVRVNGAKLSGLEQFWSAKNISRSHWILSARMRTVCSLVFPASTHQKMQANIAINGYMLMPLKFLRSRKASIINTN